MVTATTATAALRRNPFIAHSSPARRPLCIEHPALCIVHHDAPPPPPPLRPPPNPPTPPPNPPPPKPPPPNPPPPNPPPPNPPPNGPTPLVHRRPRRRRVRAEIMLISTKTTSSPSSMTPPGT